MGDGAIKDGKGWSKYWNDYKSKLKKLAAAQRSSSVQTGGGPSTDKPMDDIEKKFLQILGDNFGLGLTGVRVEPFEQKTQSERRKPVQNGSVPIADEGGDPPSSAILTWDQPGPLWRVTPPHIPETPPPVYTSSPKHTPPPSVSTPPPQRDSHRRNSPRRRRVRREQLMTAEAAHRALVRETQRRADTEERNSSILRELVDELKEIKELMQRFIGPPTSD